MALRRQISHETDQEKQAKPRPSPGVTDKKVFHVIYSLLFKYAENQDQIAQHETLVLKLLQSFTRILRWKELYKLVPKYPICPIITCMVRYRWNNIGQSFVTSRTFFTVHRFLRL